MSGLKEKIAELEKQEARLFNAFCNEIWSSDVPIAAAKLISKSFHEWFQAHTAVVLYRGRDDMEYMTSIMEESSRELVAINPHAYMHSSVKMVCRICGREENHPKHKV